MRQFCLTSAARFCANAFLFLGLCLCAHPVLAQKQEVTLSLGGVFSQSRSFHPAGAAQISGDYDLEANYGFRFLHANIAALYGEIEFVALPNRRVTTATAIVPKNYASLFVAPGVRLKLAPLGANLSMGGDWRRICALPAVRAIFQRPEHDEQVPAEVRDLVSGNPNLNVALSSSTQHNVISSGGIIVRF